MLISGLFVLWVLLGVLGGVRVVLRGCVLRLMSLCYRRGSSCPVNLVGWLTSGGHDIHDIHDIHGVVGGSALRCHRSLVVVRTSGGVGDSDRDAVVTGWHGH